jgi:SAM-dependent methyltransferase
MEEWPRVSGPTVKPALSRRYVKLCDRRDFDDPGVRDRIDAIVPGLAAPERLHRKNWEYAMLTLFLEDVGALDDAELLAVAAGHETVLFWLARRARRVVATDIYGEGSFARGEADASMLADPRAFAPYDYPRDRLEVLRMDARNLDFADSSFDAVFSLSSIEHFGGPDDISRAAAEIGRVVRPGGYAFVVTECFLDRHPLDSPRVQNAIRIVTRGRLAPTARTRRRVVDVFTARELTELIVAPSGLELVQPLELDVSPETRANVFRAQGSDFVSETGDAWPHLVLRGPGSPWTSVALALRKPE